MRLNSDLLEVLMKTKEGQEWLKSVYEIKLKINYTREKMSFRTKY